MDLGMASGWTHRITSMQPDPKDPTRMLVNVTIAPPQTLEHITVKLVGPDKFKIEKPIPKEEITFGKHQMYGIGSHTDKRERH
jgi:hypothetical protein